MEQGKMTLSIVLKERGWLLKEIAIDIMSQIASRIYYMHDVKLAYCNIKSNNVIVDPINILKLVDKTHVHVK